MNTLKTLITIALVTTAFSQNKHQSVILERFISAHNTATREAFIQFIHDTYDHELLTRIDVEDHTKFYMMIAEDFGVLKTTVYEVINEEPLRCVVHLIKKNENTLNRSIDPAEILVVEMDLNGQDPKYLKKGLGLGSLFCEIKKNK